MNINKTNDQWTARYRDMLRRQSERELKAKSKTIDEFKSFCKGFDLSLSQSNFEYIAPIGIVANFPNILGVLNPNIQRDKDGLVDCEELFRQYVKSETNPGYLFGDNYMVMLNPIFRRGLYMNSNWAPRFVDEYWRLQDDGFKSFIALDFDRVRINVDNSRYFEEDTWYGSPFREAIRTIPDGSTYLRPPQDIRQDLVALFFGSTYSLDMNWSTKRGFRTFQAIEFKNYDITLDLDNKRFHPAKYLHAEYDLENERFIHFDGAVQYYEESDYLKRRDMDFQKNVNSGILIKARSEKAFKFNGKIPIETWVKFSSHFFTGDPLVIEYFTGQYPEHVTDSIEKLRKNRDILS